MIVNVINIGGIRTFKPKYQAPKVGIEWCRLHQYDVSLRDQLVPKFFRRRGKYLVSIGAHYDPRTLLQLGIQLARRPAGIARVGAETRACELLADRSPQRRETAAGVHACEHTHGFRRRAARTDQQRQVIE